MAPPPLHRTLAVSAGLVCAAIGLAHGVSSSLCGPTTTEGAERFCISDVHPLAAFTLVAGLAASALAWMGRWQPIVWIGLAELGLAILFFFSAEYWGAAAVVALLACYVWARPRHAGTAAPA